MRLLCFILEIKMRNFKKCKLESLLSFECVTYCSIIIMKIVYKLDQTFIEWDDFNSHCRFIISLHKLLYTDMLKIHIKDVEKKYSDKIRQRK